MVLYCGSQLFLQLTAHFFVAALVPEKQEQELTTYIGNGDAFVETLLEITAIAANLAVFAGGNYGDDVFCALLAGERNFCALEVGKPLGLLRGLVELVEEIDLLWLCHGYFS